MSGGLPTFVYKRDGRRVVFEADKISQSLFGATETLGQPSAFLARELTDGVLHFIEAEIGPAQPATAQLAELIVKVIRELGHPDLAHVYAERQRSRLADTAANLDHQKPARCEGVTRFSLDEPPETIVLQCLRSFSLQAVFARDLAAAHEEGLLTLEGLSHPQELTRLVLEPADTDCGWLALLNVPARTIVFDGPEHGLTENTARPWLRGLAQFCENTARNAILNLNVTPAPAWASQHARGPLFDPIACSASSGQATAIAGVLLDETMKLGESRLRVDWHLSEGDFLPANGSRLAELARLALAGRGLAFALDRPRSRIALAPGMERGQPATIMDVALDLPRFLRMSPVDGDARLFLDKLPSLARMAVRAGFQKRNFLRSRAPARPELARGFLIERAGLMVVPTGLDDVVASLLGQGILRSELSHDLGRQIVEALHKALQQEARTVMLEIAVDGPEAEFPGVPGSLDVKELQAAGVFHSITGFGTVLSVAKSPGELCAQLAQAWKKTELVRLKTIAKCNSDE